ncbi:MAG: RNA polymerase sigma-54 factor [Bacteroidia bacterium]|nr:RNA polymerase sigma-54 factor [Bacteroidia bacterium]
MLEYQYSTLRFPGGGFLKLELTSIQKHTLSQQMQEAMNLLQMNAQELEAYLNELSAENPLIEMMPPKEMPERAMYGFVKGFRKKGASIENLEYLRPKDSSLTLKESILAQIMVARVPEMMRRELKWLAGELDAQGFLPDDYDNLQPFCGEPERYENVIKVFQSFEPAGVGARSLSECLCIQLRRLGVEDELPYIICEKYLQRIGKGQLNHISAELGVSVKRVGEAKKLISSLNPIPANGYMGSVETSYIIPDVEVEIKENGIEITTADRYMSTYGLDDYYLDMSRHPGLTEAEQEYFKAKLAQAKWIMNCVDRRRKTLLLCTYAIVENQREFFSDGASHLQPLTMTELAKQIGVHPSTISRAIRGKYLSCCLGVFPLSKFIVQELADGNGVTGDCVLALIKRMIESENDAKPLSDREISEQLMEMGYNVSRRTVAKYRGDAIIPPAFARKTNDAGHRTNEQTPLCAVNEA